MLDSTIRPWIDPPLDFIGKRMAAYNVSANTITLIGFSIGLIAIVMISLKQYNIAVIFILLNRLLDGIDGAIARNGYQSDFGGFLDVLCDFIIYAGIIFAFGFANPDKLMYVAFLIFSFIGPITSFLGYAIIAAKKQINTVCRGQKSFYYLGGICEGTETAFMLVLICIYPHYFNIISLIFGILCWLTTIGRVYNTWTDFGKSDATSSETVASVYKEPAKATESQAL